MHQAEGKRNRLGTNLLILSILVLSKKAAFVSPQVLVKLPRASSFVSLSSLEAMRGVYFVFRHKRLHQRGEVQAACFIRVRGTTLQQI